MDLSAALTHVRILLTSVELEDHTAAAALTALTENLQESVPSFLGLQLALVRHGHPVTLTAFTRTVQPSEVATSLRLPLSLLEIPGADPASMLSFYAGTSGAFVDLAADLSYALERPTATSGSGSSGQQTATAVAVDDPVQPTTTTSGLDGVSELSTIRRAIGMLIGDGCLPEDAETELARQATATGSTILACAIALTQAQPKQQPVDPVAPASTNGTDQMTESSALPGSADPDLCPRHRSFEAARQSADLTVDQLWVHYMALGGVLADFDIDAYLAGFVSITAGQQDVLACALNERLADLHHPTRLPYREVLPPRLGDLADRWRATTEPES